MPMNASEWIKQFDLEMNEDNTVTVEGFCNSLCADADLASSPGLLHSLCCEYDVYVFFFFSCL